MTHPYADPDLAELEAELEALRRPPQAEDWKRDLAGELLDLRRRRPRAGPSQAPYSRFGEPLTEAARQEDVRTREAQIARETEEGIGLPLTAARVFAYSLIPGRTGQEAVDLTLEQAARGGVDFTRTLARIPVTHPGQVTAGMRRGEPPPTEEITTADVLGAAAVGGTATKEYAYLQALGPVAGRTVGQLGRIPGRVGRFFRGAPSPARALASPSDVARLTRAAQVAEELGRAGAEVGPNARALLGAAGRGAVRGTAEGAVFGVGRETLEQGPSVEAVAHGLEYGIVPIPGTPIPIAPLLGGALGAAAAAQARVPRAARATDPFHVLGLNRETATAQDIETAFAQRAHRWHPDRNPAPDATEIFQMYAAARDAAKRELGARAAVAPEPTPAETATPPPPRRAPREAPQEPARQPAARSAGEPPPAPAGGAPLDAVADEAALISVIPKAQRTPEQQARYEELSAVLKAESARMAVEEPPTRTAEEVARAAEPEPPLPRDIVERERRRPEFERRQQQVGVQAERRLTQRREAPVGAVEELSRALDDVLAEPHVPTEVPRGRPEAPPARPAAISPEAVPGAPEPARAPVREPGEEALPERNPKFRKMPDEQLEARLFEIMDRMSLMSGKAGEGIKPFVRKAPDLTAPIVGTAVTGEAGRAIGRLKDDARILGELEQEYNVRGIDYDVALSRYMARPEGAPPGSLAALSDEEFDAMLRQIDEVRAREEAPQASPIAPGTRFTAAAIRLPDNRVFTGPTHPDAVMKAQRALGMPVNEILLSPDRYESGFVTAEQDFVPRKAAEEAVGAPEGEARSIVGREVPEEVSPRAEAVPAAPRGEPAAESTRVVPEPAIERPTGEPPERGGVERGEPARAAGEAAGAEPPVQPGGIPGPRDLEPVARPSGPGGRPAGPGARAGRGDRERAGERLSGRNYRITADDAIGAGGLKEKARGNIDAIRHLHAIETEGRPATPDEQAALVRYVGWGGIPQVFDVEHKEWGNVARELKATLTDDEWRAAKASTPNAHYTSQPVIEAMYQALDRLGFTGGRTLEPAAGVGHFLGLAPDALRGQTRFTAIELDSITGRIAKHLYPQSDVRVAGFEEVHLPDNFYDAAVGNVPFGNYPVYDPKYEKLGFSIHDYFFAKALDKVRPGGVVAFITSRYTMDRQASNVRKYLAERADLLGAIRLPRTAFEKNANTLVTTDILFLLKRAPGEAPSGPAWLETRGLKGAEAGMTVNEYFVAHQEMMLGRMEYVRGQYGKSEPHLLPREGEELTTALRAAIERLPQHVMRQAVTAPIFTERVIRLQPKIEKLERTPDALVAVLAERGRVDVGRIAELVGRSEADVLRELRGEVFDDPETRTWVTADGYLSGNVRRKLEVARAAAAIDERYAENVKALEAVQPEDIPHGLIDVRLGAPWVPSETVQAFVEAVLGKSRYNERPKVTHLASEALWALEVPYDVRYSVASRKEWGTDAYDAGALMEDALNQKVPTVWRPTGKDEPRQVDEQATLDAREKQEKLKEHFREWVWKDAERAKFLHRLYNDRFNNLRQRTFDGSNLTLPGASTSVSLRPHQKDAIWRILHGGNTLLAHVVGAGKTYAMVAAGMEAKRIGVARKPMYTVPNHMLAQFGREFLQLYPAAKILLATEEEFAAARRKEFVAKVATGEWDAVIMTHSSFGKIPVSREFEEEFIKEQLQQYEDLYQQARESRSRDLTKLIEKGKKRLQTRLKELANRKVKDDVLSFEELGVDMLFVDEADMFKNLEAATKMRNVGISASQRAQDLYLKSRYLNRISPGRGLVFATGTPIANSVVEMFTMQRYLQPPLLAERQLEHLDAWAAAFGEHKTAMELAPDGSGYRMHTRFASFRNVPELTQMFRQVADVQTAEMLKLPTPKVRGERPSVVAAPATPELKQYVASLVDRAAAVKARMVKPDEDNMLVITTDGRKAALDMRLVRPEMEDNPTSKVNRAVDHIYEIWKDTAKQRAAQLVFCDFSAPKKPGEGFSVYNDVREKLLARGIPADEIAFMHDADTKAAKDALFRKVREGRVRILMGSTEKMGAGTNVQDRLIASHHLDAPWRPRDIEQRDGRIVRQGNRHEEVQIYRYVTDGSFDAYMWQTLETKARFIDQVMRADDHVRTVEDVDSRALTFAEIKAIASGNPLVLEKATVDAEVAKLARLEKAHRDRLFRVRQELALLPEQVAMLGERITGMQADQTKLKDTKGDKFVIVLGTRTYTDRTEAAPVIMNRIASAQVLAKEHGDVQIGEFAGFPLMVEVHRPAGRPPRVFLRGASDYESEVPLETSPAGALQVVEYLPKRLSIDLENAKNTLEDRKKKRGDLERLKDEPFEHADRLAELLKKQEGLNSKLDLNKNEVEIEPVERKIPDEGTPEAYEVESVEAVVEHMEQEAGGAEAVNAAGDGSRFRRDLLDRLANVEGLRAADLEHLTDTQLISIALDNGLLHEATSRSMLETLNPPTGAGGFLRIGPTEPPAPPTGEGGGPRVFVDPIKWGVDVLEGWFMPSRRVALRLMRSKQADRRAVGQKLYDLVRAGQAAHLRLSRLLDEYDARLQQIVHGLTKADQGRLVALLRKYERPDDLPADTPTNLKESFTLARTAYRKDWRDLGTNERMMLSERSRAILDEALRQWPEGTAAPDFDNLPINHAAIWAAATRKGRTGAPPADRAGWEVLYTQLKAEKTRVQKPVFMDSPDLRRIYGMIRGEGGIMAYFPEVYMGDWVVRAGPFTKRFVDRFEAIEYARHLLEGGHYTEDIPVQRDAFIPEAGLFLSRAQWLKLRADLERESGETAAVVSKALGAAKVRIQPRKRFFAHLQPRRAHLETFEQDFVRANRVYQYRLARKLALDPFRKAGTELVEQLPADGEWRDWAASYLADTQGVPQLFMEHINNTLSKLTFGHIKPLAIQRGTSTWQKLMSNIYLGWSVPTAVVNLTQTAINTIPAFEKNGVQWTWRGLRELLRMTDESKQVLDELGIDFQHPKYLVGEFLPQGKSVSETRWFMPLWLFNKSEYINRGIAGLARYYERRAAGVSQANAIAEAREFVYDTHFDYSVADAPRIMRNPVGRAFFQFKLYSLNELFFAEQLFRWGNARQKATFLFNLWVFGGLRVLAYGTPLFALNWLLGHTGLFEDDEGHKVTPWEKLWLEVGDITERPIWLAIKYGLFAALGVNLSDRLGFGGPREFEGTIPGAKLKQLAKALTAKNPTERESAMRDLAPVIVKRLTKAWEAAKQGKIRDRYGNVIIEPATPADVTRTAIGVQSVAEAERSARLERERRERQRLQRARSQWLDRAATAYRKDGIQAAIAVVREARAAGVKITLGEVLDYRERRDEPDIRGRIRTTPRELREELFTPEERRRYPSRRRRQYHP